MSIRSKKNDAEHIPCVIEAFGLALQSSNGLGAIIEGGEPTLINGDNPGWQNGVCQAIGVDFYNMTTTGGGIKTDDKCCN